MTGSRSDVSVATWGNQSITARSGEIGSSYGGFAGSLDRQAENKLQSPTPRSPPLRYSHPTHLAMRGRPLSMVFESYRD
jgi:hypothetical protein